MSDTLLVTIFIASIAAALGLGWLTATLRAHKTTATLAHERSNALERVAALEKTRTEFSNTFAALASQALQHNSGEFLKLAQENLKQFHIQAQGDLTQKERSIENFLTPIKEALAKTEQQIQLMEKDRKEAYGSISRHLETMALTQQQLQRETSSLVNALRRPE
ncbi:MAG: hypothetical protein FD130_1636, partial [Halothiobacillaceae bacterium]